MIFFQLQENEPPRFLRLHHGLGDGLCLHINHDSSCHRHRGVFLLWEKGCPGFLNVLAVLMRGNIQRSGRGMEVIHHRVEELTANLVATLAELESYDGHAALSSISSQQSGDLFIFQTVIKSRSLTNDAAWFISSWLHFTSAQESNLHSQMERKQFYSHTLIQPAPLMR